MTLNQKIRFKLNLSADQYLKVYQGLAKTITTLADDGRRIAFPAQNIKPFLSHEGIYGHFEMELTPANKFVAIKKIT
jgi:hypothetical protein